MSEKGKIGEISETLRNEILSGKFDVSGKMPSDRMLMRRFSVARATVQAAMKDLLERHLVERRPGYGTFLSDCAAGRASQKFGLIVPDAYYPFYARICRGIEEGAKRRGWSTVAAALGSGNLRERAVKAVEFAGICVRERVGGVFLQPLQFLKDGETFNRTILDVFRRASIPVVLIDSDFVVSPNRSEYDFVGVDNTNAGYLLAKHVIAAGAKRIVYFSNDRPAPTSLKRGNGVGVAVAEAGLKWGTDSVFFADPGDTRAARRLFAGRRRPDAIVAVNDYIAFQLLKTLRAIGVDVPNGVLLAGINGDPVAEESIPQITTAIQPCEEIGRTAVELMFERIENPNRPPRAVTLNARLVARASTCPSKNVRSRPECR